MPDEEKQKVDCRFCDVTDLEWDETDEGKWRLVDENGEPHRCRGGNKGGGGGGSRKSSGKKSSSGYMDWSAEIKKLKERVAKLEGMTGEEEDSEAF